MRQFVELLLPVVVGFIGTMLVKVANWTDDLRKRERGLFLLFITYNVSIDDLLSFLDDKVDNVRLEITTNFSKAVELSNKCNVVCVCEHLTNKMCAQCDWIVVPHHEQMYDPSLLQRYWGKCVTIERCVGLINSHKQHQEALNGCK